MVAGNARLWGARGDVVLGAWQRAGSDLGPRFSPSSSVVASFLIYAFL